MNEISVYNLEAKEIEKIKLNDAIFSGRVNKTLLSEAMLMYQANKRKGLASTKVRSEVRGGGKKPWRQKGTGRARAGSIRSPLWRGGGIVFGPHPRDYSYYLPKKARRQALLSALNDKFNEKQFLVVDRLVTERIKTKDFMNTLNSVSNIVTGFKKIDNKKAEKSAPRKLTKFLFVIEDKNKELVLSSRNIRYVSVVLTNNLNAMDILLNDYVIFSKGALEALIKNFKLN